MKYVLENKSEADRLERQSRHPNYNLTEELRPLGKTHYSKILDAGCGTGLMSRYLKGVYPEAKIIACDLSDSRLKAARALAESSGIEFVEQDLKKLSFESDSFDLIVCRYVVQHMSVADREAALNEFMRVLRPGGTLHVIEMDGFYLNLYPQTKIIEEAFKKFLESSIVDFNVGRKLPSLLQSMNFSLVDWEIEAQNCKGQRDELELIAARLENVFPALISLLGSEKNAKAFTNELLGVLSKPGTVYFQNKFLITAKKTQRLRVAK